MPSGHIVHFCIFCKKEHPRVQQHFVRKHRDEEKVKEIMAIEDRNRRFWEWKLLKQQGDDLFNKTALDTPKKLVRRTIMPSPFKRYFTCPKCYGRMRTTSRYKHVALCSERLKNLPEDDTAGDIFDGIREGLLTDLRRSPNLAKFIENLFHEKGREDKNLMRTAIADLLNLEEQLQLLGKQNEEHKHLTQFFTSGNVDRIIQGIRNMAGEYKKANNIMFRFPWKAQRLCRLVTKLGKFLIIMHFKRNQDREAEHIRKFLTLFEDDSQKFIRKQAIRTIKLKKQETQQKLPTTTDIIEVTRYLKDETPKLLNNLKETRSENDWRLLAENLLCRLTIFNRRRGGAIEKLTVENFTSRALTREAITEEAMYNLTEEESKFLENVKIINIIHKCDNLVPVYITKDLEHGMDVLLEYRDCGKVHPQNHYFFAATRKSLNPIRGVCVMKKYRRILPEEVRDLFTATNLRKHGATTSKILDLSPQDAEDWATHMGHTLTIHKKYYRQKENVELILKTGRLLNALNNGTLKYFKGKKLQDIPLTAGAGDPEIAEGSSGTAEQNS